MLAELRKSRRDSDGFAVYTQGRDPFFHQEECHSRWHRHWAENQRSVLYAPVGTGKSSSLRLFLLHQMGRNPNVQIAWVSATERHPKKQLRAIKDQIVRNPRVRASYPHLKPGRVWSSTEIEIERSTLDPDPTIQVFGAFTSSLLGSRANIVIFDDLCTFTNTLTASQRDKMGEWCGEVISRLQKGAKVISIGHPWHEKDQNERFRRMPGWAFLREEAYTEVEGRRTFLAPRILDEETFEQKRQELGPLQSEMMLFCRLPSRNMGRFRQAWFDQALEYGMGLEFVPRWDQGRAYTGVDLGHEASPGHDKTVIFTAAILPGEQRRILDIRSGYWTAPETLRELKDVHRRYGSIIGVENVGAQRYLLQFAAELETLPLREHHTGINKHDLAHGVESMGLELAQGRWIFPCPLDDDGGVGEPDEEVAAVIEDSLRYDPARHTGDHLMAWWICRETMRKSPFAGLPDPEEDFDLFAR